jgi:hypothetical protein
MAQERLESLLLQQQKKTFWFSCLPMSWYQSLQLLLIAGLILDKLLCVLC